MMDYIKLNKATWNSKTGVHLESDFYDMPSFMEGKNSLNEIELALLGDVSGLKVLHLQCHFGQDTLSLQRMGARVTGVDISDVAISKAKELTVALNLDANFICCDIYELKDHLDEKFDIAFTSYGTIGWLPDMDRWADIVTHFLKPNGKFVFAEFHPVVWMFNDEFSEVAYNYFNSGPIVETIKGSYTDRDADIENTSVFWNHSLSEVTEALLKAGLLLEEMKEYDYSPYDCFQGTTKIDERKYRIAKMKNHLPMVYALKMRK